MTPLVIGDWFQNQALSGSLLLAVPVAMLAGLHPLGVILASVFVAGMLVGADSMSRAIAVPNYIADVIVATSLLAMLVATLFAQYRLRRNRG